MRLLQHLRTVHNHRKEVRKLCFKCGLIKQGLMHDLSKYSITELRQARYWTGARSPIDAEIDEKGFSEAWLHHKGRNKHHVEYWLDPTHDVPPVKIPLKHLIEMFCDRVAACKTYQKDNYNTGSAFNYLKSRPQDRKYMNDETYNMLFYLCSVLSNLGEDITCKHIKHLLKNKHLY